MKTKYMDVVFPIMVKQRIRVPKKFTKKQLLEGLQHAIVEEVS